MPKISVIVPVYKVEKYLHRCVDSILNQTFTDFELILVDDGSPDNCPSICDEYASRDNRIIVIHRKNGGLSAARNTGIDWSFSNSNSEWLTFIDSDDWVHLQYLEFLYNSVIVSNQKVSICSFSRIENESDFNINNYDFQYQGHNTERFYCENCTNATVAWGKLYAKECFKQIRYPIGKIHEDEFVTYRIIFKYPDIVFINLPLYAYFRNDNSIMGSNWAPKRLVKIRALKEQAKFFKKNKYITAYYQSLGLFISYVLHSYNRTKKHSNPKICLYSIVLLLRSLYLFVIYNRFIMGRGRNVYSLYIESYYKIIRPFYNLKKFFNKKG